MTTNSKTINIFPKACNHQANQIIIILYKSFLIIYLCIKNRYMCKLAYKKMPITIFASQRPSAEGEENIWEKIFYYQKKVLL